ncbi:hypothetical protein RHSIM_Rhsim09G0013400 [Rhododendron simsii]|uniref:Uncharacterized protein n=1 Tax=Rhododendron simsii TaxID=118357 RepID=A0A834GHT6_RHOSS|nr:hypothetical protein RHSIM_Rhsim09G0013400 [Rhododendron simsii]
MGYDDQKIQYQPEDAPSKGLYGAMPSGYTVRPQGYGAMPSGYSTVPPPGYGASLQAYGAPLRGPYSALPPTYGVPLQGPYVAPRPIYVTPPPTCPCLRNDQWHAQNPHPKKTESDCEQFWTAW